MRGLTLAQKEKIFFSVGMGRIGSELVEIGRNGGRKVGTVNAEAAERGVWESSPRVEAGCGCTQPEKKCNSATSPVVIGRNENFQSATQVLHEIESAT